MPDPNDNLADELDDELTPELRRVVHDLADAAPHEPGLAVAVRSRVRHRRSRLAALAALGVVAAAGSSVVVAQSWSGRPDPVTAAATNNPGSSTTSMATSPVASTATGPCAAAVAERVVPEWARAGFSDPEPVVPYAISASGDVVAILFGGQLHAPQDPEVNNKVLWVSRTGGAGPLHIRARLDGSTVTADVDVPDGPGPSTVDMPQPGCWQMTLTWDGRTDSIALPYVAPAP